MFLDLANASTHTNYLIQIVKEHLFSQNNSARQRSGSLAVISTTKQALFKINLSFFSTLKTSLETYKCCPSRRAGIIHIIVICVYLFIKKAGSFFTNLTVQQTLPHAGSGIIHKNHIGVYD